MKKETLRESIYQRLETVPSMVMENGRRKKRKP